MDIAIRPTDAAIKEAICLKCANCYGALSFANAIGGSRSDAWELCHTYNLVGLLKEADERGLDLSGLKSAVQNEPVEQTMYYRRARGTISEAEFQTEFRQWQKG